MKQSHLHLVVLLLRVPGAPSAAPLPLPLPLCLSLVVLCLGPLLRLGLLLEGTGLGDLLPHLPMATWHGHRRGEATVQDAQKQAQILLLV